MRTLILLMLCASASSAQSAPPGTDIYLAPLSISGSHIAVGSPVNVTHRKGYDNQPSFTPDGASILYTSIRDDGQADIWRYDLRDRSTHQVTHTPESEYSPTVMPGGRRFSVIRVERDSTQRLWSFAMDGSDPALVLNAVKPVGYHAWVDDSTLALFVLGQPSTLQVVTIGLQRPDTVARDIGRSLQPIPGNSGASFVQHRPDSAFTLSRFELGRVDTLVTMPRGSEFVAWLPNGTVLTAQDSQLLAFDAVHGGGWHMVADLGSAGVHGITRLAVSRDGRWLALVAPD